jgi:2-dehydropantoate 2-reductase
MLSNHKPMKIAVMGTGGLGGYFGGVLARNEHKTSFIARGENLHAMREQGLKVLSPQGDFLVSPVQVTDRPDEVGVVDLILFCVKSYDVDDALKLIQPMVGPETVVLPMQNGIEHIANLQACLGEQPVLGGLVMINAHKHAPGVVQHVADSGRYQLEFGEWSGGESTRCARLQAIFTQAGLTTAASQNISERMWWKLAVFSGASVLAMLRGAISRVWTAETKALLHQAVAEAVAVAATQGILLPASLPDDVVELGNRLPPEYKPSLLVDLERGNRLEMEAITGFVTRLGKRTNVPTPVNNFVYACLKPYVNGSA